MNMTLREKLETTFGAYEADGRAIFIVTLSTFVASESFGCSDRMRHFWDHHFIYRVREQLPYQAKEKLDSDYVLERRPFFHYHGFLALPYEHRHHIWKGGALHPRFNRALNSFRHAGKYRPFRINEYEILPANGVTAWAKYITKTADYIPSVC